MQLVGVVRRTLPIFLMEIFIFPSMNTFISALRQRFDMGKTQLLPIAVLLLISSSLSGCLEFGADENETVDETPTWPLSSSFILSHSDPTSTYASANANPTGGTEPYQYQWSLDGVIQSGTMSYIDFYDLSVGSHSVELKVMDSKGEMQSSTQTIVVEASQVWVPDWKINIEFRSFTPRAIDSSDDITMEFYWDESNTGEFEEGVLCSTWDRSDGDDVEITLSKKCVVDISDETHQVGYTACAYIDDGSSSSERIDIYSEDTTYGACLLVKDVEIDGQYDFETRTYDGLNDNDDDDIELHGKFVVYWEWIDDGEYVDED